MENILTVTSTIAAPVEKVWTMYNNPEDIKNWNQASEDWHCPASENDLQVGGHFKNTMAAKDGSFSFDFSGTYTAVIPHSQIDYTMDDGRKASVIFQASNAETIVNVSFEAEGQNTKEEQQQGWQAILDNFKRYVEKPTVLIKKEYEVKIASPVEKVFFTMLHKETYKQWTAEFNPTSFFEGSWNKGEKILFIGLNENGKRGGMVAKIAENIPNKFISILHLGILDGDKEITDGPTVEGWAGAQENYSFNEENGITTVSVAVDTNEEYVGYFDTTWPKALNKLKEICE